MRVTLHVDASGSSYYMHLNGQKLNHDVAYMTIITQINLNADTALTHNHAIVLRGWGWGEVTLLCKHNILVFKAINSMITVHGAGLCTLTPNEKKSAYPPIFKGVVSCGNVLFSGHNDLVTTGTSG